MKGLDLSELYFKEYGRPLFEKECRDLLPKMAIGLVGDGSECFGFDDEISRDHDWGPSFCIWLNEEEMKSHGTVLQKLYSTLPQSFKGFEVRQSSLYGDGRVGVLEIQSFFQRYLGTVGLPQTNRQWLAIPENALATAVNGRVFQDSAGQFSAIRTRLLGHYPKDVRLKKIAARCMSAGQAGQYNYTRSLKRNELYAAAQAEMKFLEAALSMVFLLNRSYLPFYKWAHRAVGQLPILGSYSHEAITTLIEERDMHKKEEIIEQFSQALIDQLRKHGLSEGESDFLPDHGPLVQAKIEDDEIRGYNVLVG